MLLKSTWQLNPKYL